MRKYFGKWVDGELVSGGWCEENRELCEGFSEISREIWEDFLEKDRENARIARQMLREESDHVAAE